MILTFKQFNNRLTSIFEELTPEQKSKVDKWPKATRETKSHTDHYFGKGNDVVEQPLAGTEDKSEVHRAIERHLGKDISSSEYKEGRTKDNYGRDVKIGGLLTKTKAPSNLINSFANDSTRQGKKYTGLSVKVSRHPHDVAGQTSSGQSWEQQSCKNFSTGCNRQYLKHEVKAGSVVGYLKDHTGKEIARATLHPYKNEDGDTVYQVNSHYGIDHKGFKDHMENVAKQLSSPFNPNAHPLYKIHPKVYDDAVTGDILHPASTPEHITNMLKHHDRYVNIAALRHPNATTEHISKALKSDDYALRVQAVKHPKATSEHISKGLEDSDATVRLNTLKNPNATTEHIEKALKDKSVGVRHAAISHPKITPEHIEQGLKDDAWEVRHGAAKNPNATSEQIHRMLNHEEDTVREAAAENRSATPEHINKALDDEHDYIAHAAISNPNANMENLKKGLNHRYGIVRTVANSKLKSLGMPKQLPRFLKKAIRRLK